MTDQNIVANDVVQGDVVQQQNNEVAEGGDQQQQEQRQPTGLESFMAVTKSLIIRALIIYFISSFFRRPQTSPTDAQNSSGTQVSRPPAWNYFENGTIFDLHVYISDSYDYVDFRKPENLIWFQKELAYGDWYSGENGDGIYTHTAKIRASTQLMNNGSIYLHTYVTKSGKSPNPDAGKDYAGPYKGYARRMLSKYKKIRANRNYNLLTGDGKLSSKELVNENNNNNNNIDAKKLEKDIILSHWHPNLTINLVTDQINWVEGSVPPQLDEFIEFVDKGKTYLPVVFYNDYWNMLRDYQPINETTPELELHLTYQPLSMIKWQLYAAQAMKNKWTNGMFGDLMSTGGEELDEDQDSLKETLLETNPYLLGLTMIVSILHSVFEILAFKNDIQFWNNRKSLEGLSVRSVFFSVFQSLIVLLYVMDNDAFFMIKLSCFIGLGIEIWKIQKVVDIKFDWSRKFFGIIPHMQFKDKGSYIESSTKQYDNLAFKYLGWVCFPLLIGYSTYSLIYNEHKGWYSFVLNILYGFLLTFGFIMMTPQLFINYKLKSVAHLPWRMMTYKFFNTFIDDVFAFVIKMPTMYRLGCFRDDIIFFVFLYQRWIYKVDHKRVNEFGFSGEMENEAIANNSTEIDNNKNAIEATSPNNKAITNGPIEKEKTPKDKKRD